MPKWILYSLIPLSLGAYILIGYYIDRSNFPLLISVYSSLFLASYILFKNKAHLDLNLLLLVSVIFRLCLLFSIPELSDDFYRFLWDGRIQQLNFNPFDYTPGQILNQSSDVFLHQIFPLLNSPDYFSVYPQLCQSIFWLASGIGQDELLVNIIVLKLFIILSEICTIILLKKLLNICNRDKMLVLIYALNPLVIIELTGNIHFEALMISFFLLAVWLIKNNRTNYSAIALSLAIQAKLLPIISFPLLVRKLGLQRTLGYGILCFAITVLISLGTINSFERISHIAESLNLYYGAFEFNAGVYTLFRSIGWWILGYNPINVVTKILFMLSIAGMIWIYLKKNDLLSGFFWLLTVYLVFSAIVHPWYLCPLIALTPFVKYRFALVWSALIPLSYIAYSTIPYKENILLITVEYLIVAGFLVYEYQKIKESNLRKNPEGRRNN